jgi:hypothetical protein
MMNRLNTNMHERYKSYSQEESTRALYTGKNTYDTVNDQLNTAAVFDHSSQSLTQFKTTSSVFHSATTSPQINNSSLEHDTDTTESEEVNASHNC